MNSRASRVSSGAVRTFRKALRPALRPPQCRVSSSVAPPPPEPNVKQGEGGEGNLGKIISDTIKATGPMSISRYMQFCLGHPIEGYYAKGDVFGKRGDFVTSPEISQIFGELLAIWLLTRYEAAGRPPSVRIIELGPGRGTLMDDVLRIRGRISSIQLVENSIKMQDIQRARLEERTSKEGIKMEWYDKIDDIPQSDDFTLLLAHEFFDALPINVFELREGGWREVQVGLAPVQTIRGSNASPLVSAPPPASPSSPYSSSSPSSSSGASSVLLPSLSSPSASSPPRTSDRPPIPASPARPVGQAARPSGSPLQLVISSDPNPLSTVIPSTSPRFARLPLGSRIEVAPDSFRIMRSAGALIGGRGGGAGLVVDYGGDRFYGGSFRAFRNHKIVDPLSSPGMCDLTANVDFAYLKEALVDTARPLGPIPQGTFLNSLGLQPRLDKLLSSATDAGRRRDIESGAKRLVDMLGMGGQYQVMGVVPLRSSSPADSGGVSGTPAENNDDEVYPFPS